VEHGHDVGVGGDQDDVGSVHEVDVGEDHGVGVGEDHDVDAGAANDHPKPALQQLLPSHPLPTSPKMD